MNFEPQKFFIGLIDFFSILMPGALLAYFTKDDVQAWLGSNQVHAIDSVEGATVFLFASYLLGHFLHSISAVLDEWIDDPLRKLTELGQARRLADGKARASGHLRKLAQSDLLFGPNADAAVQHVLRLKAGQFEALSANSAINAFQWSKAFLSKEHPEGLLEVHRFEANSKFFRSFVVVLTILTVFYLFQHHGIAALLCLGATAPALWRYIDQRFKATQQAYWFLLTLEALKNASPRKLVRDDGLTHAGGVVYRLNKDGQTEYLLVEASRNRKEWVVPKGHVEAGEEPRMAAVREVHEETGHWARVERWLEDSPLGKKKDAPRVRWFLMRSDDKGDAWRQEHRQHRWLPIDKAKPLATYSETRELLDRVAHQ